MRTTSEFLEYYGTLSDDALIHIVLTRELLPDAAFALKTELVRRGISDLSTQREEMVLEAAAQEQAWQTDMNRRAKISAYGNKFLYGLGFLMLGYGIFRIFVKDPGGQDDTIMAVVGPVIIIGAWLRAKLAAIWYEKVLFRKPPV